MAYPNDRYWYVPNNGNGTWNNNQGNWYYGTGGTLGIAPIPNNTNDVYFNAASGSGFCIVSGGRLCGNLIMTGYTGTITGSPSAIIYVYGSTITLSASGVFDPVNNPALYIYSGTTTNFTTNGQTVGDIQIWNNSTLVMQDDLICKNNAILTLAYGHFNANNKNITIGLFTDGGYTNAKTLTMGSGTWTLGQAGPVDSGEYVWNVSQPNSLTVNTGTWITRILRYREAAGLATAIASSGSVSTIVLRDIVTATSGTPPSSLVYGWPTSGTVCIDDEAFTYTGISGNNTLTGVTRAAAGTSQGAHSVGRAVLCIGPVVTTLSQALGTGDANLYLNDMSILGGVHGYLLVDDEIISYTSRSATSGQGYVSGLTRGVTSYGSVHSANIAHNSGIKVRPVEKSIFDGGGKNYGNSIHAGVAGQYMFFQAINTSPSNINSIRMFATSPLVGGVGWLAYLQGTSNTLFSSSYTASITSAPSSINEGSPGTIYTRIYGRAAGETSYWDIATNAGDFSTSSGSFNTDATSGNNIIDGAAGSFTVTPTADLTTEGSETFTVNVRDYSGASILATTNAITINDTSTTPSYSATLSGYTTSMTEVYTTNTFTVTTSGIPNGTTLYYQIIKVSNDTLAGYANNAYLLKNRTDNNLTDPVYRGGSVVVNNGTASFSIIAGNFNLSGTNDQFKVVLRQYPIITVHYMYFYNVSWGSGNINYNTSFTTYTDPTIYFPVGQVIEFYIDSTLVRGTITSISNTTVYINLTYSSSAVSLANSGVYVYVAYRYNDQLAISSTISITNASYTLSRSPDSNYTDEGQTKTFTLTTSGYPTGVTCYWKIDPTYLAYGDAGYSGYTSTADWAATSGSFVTNSSGVGTFSITPLIDNYTDPTGTEFGPVLIYLGTDVGTFAGSYKIHFSYNWVVDTSTNPEEFLPFFL